MKDKEIQEQESFKLQLKNKKRIQELKEKGITLIALVVTIILLLILVGVTLNMALSGDGLFSKARDAAEKYKKAQEEEAELIREIGKEMNSEYVGAYVEGYKPTGGECTITGEQSGLKNSLNENGEPISGVGEDGSQTFATAKESGLKWRIWDYDGTVLRLILERPTLQQLTLSGTAGYNNGVWALNEICRKCFGQYGSDGKMKTGINVANIKRSDIQKIWKYDYTTYKCNEDSDDYVNDGNINFGEMRTFSAGNNNYPIMWGNYDKNWTYEYTNGKGTGGDEECRIWEDEGTEEERLGNSEAVESSVSFKQSHYLHKCYDDEFINSRYYELLFLSGDMHGKWGDSYYWLATRDLRFYKGSVCFGLGNVWKKEADMSCFIGGSGFVYSNGTGSSTCLPLRPIVSINLNKSNYNLEKIEINNGATYKLTEK